MEESAEQSARGDAGKKAHEQTAGEPFDAFYEQGEDHRRGVDGEIGEKRAYAAREHGGDGTQDRRRHEYHRVAAVEKEVAGGKAEHHRCEGHERRHECGEHDGARGVKL